MKFTSITYNLHKGKSFLSRRSILKELKENLGSLKVDLIFLQEVMGLAEGLNHLEYFADTLFDHQAYGRNAVRDDLHYGNAILSRYPIVEFSNRNISTNRFEQRGSLQAKIQMGDRQIIALSVHLDLLEKGRVQQVQSIIHQVKHCSEGGTPVLIGGDFNDWRGRLCGRIETELEMDNIFHELELDSESHTFPSFFPRVNLDRFYYRHLKPVQVQVLKGPPWNRFSDHCPVMATFEF